MIITFIYHELCVVVTMSGRRLFLELVRLVSYRALTDGCQFALVQKQRQSHL